MLNRENFYSFPWESTPLSAPDGWPKQLRFLADFLLCSKQPMFILWGCRRAFVFNPPYQAIWGIDTLAHLGQPMEEVAAGAWDEMKPLVEQVFEGEAFIETDFPVAADGRRRYFDFSYTPIYDYEAPQVAAALCITTDVTDRFVSAERTRVEREILALTVENVTEGVALVESDLSLVLWNEPFRVHFGYTSDEIRTGMNAMELMLKTAQRGDLGPGDPMLIVDGLAQSIRATESARLEIQRANGKVLSLYRRTISGSRFLLVSQDVTDERMAARLKDELVSTVSHELRTPLTAISGALGMVAGGAAGQLPERAGWLIEIAHRNSERLTSLVNDLLDVDKLQSGRVEFHMESLDLGELVRAAIEQNQPYAERARVGLCDEIPERSLVASVDRSRMLQVLTNLISNAVKFSPSDEPVTVRLVKHGECARISVVDRGPGVAEDFRDRLFDRFTQQDATASRIQQGTGLGLAISKHIVEGHGGTIHLDTTTSVGATFHIDLPLDGRSGGRG